jgi:tetratricopeptide (TPR) repeat protein
MYFLVMASTGCFLLFKHVSAKPNESEKLASGYLGSSECRPCHEKFYQLWAPSHHGMAMQPYTQSFAAANLKPQLEEIVIGKKRYQAVTDQGAGYVIESGPEKKTRYPILHVLGGKNVYYFLTFLERGHLQVLPVAYDVKRQQWFDTAASAVRHFPDHQDEAIDWRDRPYTFNTSCYGCHVSQIVKNYDIKTDSYHTEWKEPGINCETCHGPAAEHVTVCLQAAAQGKQPTEMKLNTITQSRGFTSHQVDSSCSICHAKGTPITNEFIPGEDFFQHYDLVTLEHPDFYPDGRDLGENYTYTTWRMSPCVKASKLDCMYCHTSSGRYRFKNDKTNAVCSSCHAERSEHLADHTHHTAQSGVEQCIQCHMPQTEFGRMIRTDHSMRPPMPSATLRFQSPNACNLCHKDKDAKWADDSVRKWHKDDYQKPVLEIAALIDQARRDNGSNLSDMLTYLQRKDKDEIFANSLVRLLRGRFDKSIGNVLAKLLKDDPSALIRSSAANGLEPYLDKATVPLLAAAANDPYRLVRIRAASTLATVPEQMIPAELRKTVQKASTEYIESMNSRPDDATSHYNLGNYYAAKSEWKQSIQSYETSIKLQKDLILPYVNASLVYNRLGDNDTAAARLKQAITLDPNNVAAHLNLALLYGEMKQYADAEKAFRKTFQLDPTSAVAAYNVGVLLARHDIEKAIHWCQKAYELESSNSNYAYTLAYYYAQKTCFTEAVQILHPLVDRKTDNPQIYVMLANVYTQMNQISKAIEVCQAAIENQSLDEQARVFFQDYIQRLTMP